jgi:hypothetical protein
MAVFIGAIKGSNPLTAKTKKNQANLNKAIYWGVEYDKINDLRDRADDSGDEKAYRKYNRMAENAFEKYLGYISQLPKVEQKRVEKFIYG